jgi:3-deoxy-D-manno-octulosonate 8-phosphate phosphatase (KDO 8-P phosphatase)
MGVINKLSIVNNLCSKLNINIRDVAYIGDDINDINLLKVVGISAVPNQSPNYVAKYAQIKLSKNGGDGAFREFVEIILAENNMLEKALDIYLKTQESS